MNCSHDYHLFSVLIPLTLTPHKTQRWLGTRDPGGLCLSRSGTGPGAPSTCLTPTPSSSSSSASSCTSSGAQTTSATGCSGSWPPSSWSSSGRSLATPASSSRESKPTPELLENTTVWKLTFAFDPRPQVQTALVDLTLLSFKVF